jgi:hypothetical protein
VGCLKTRFFFDSGVNEYPEIAVDRPWWEQGQPVWFGNCDNF